MNKKIYLAFLWHHHQPYYRLTSTGEFQMPWVRLHGIKDYYGMAALLQQFPKIKSNINLVPSLLKQIKEYIAGDSDRLLFLAQQSVSDLTIQDKQYVLENSFSAHPQYMISVYPRYKELYSRLTNHTDVIPGAGIRVSQESVKEFSNQDFIDLLVCSNLVWFHPLIIQGDSELKSLRQKGRDYTEDDKKLVIQKQKDYLAEIIPLHRKLQENKQIEITTTPFYHPILPLLCDMNSAKQAMPNVSLPKIDQMALLEDARWQVSEAVKFYKDAFGVPVKGLWPAEGSVSPEIIPLLAEHNINYFATDEEVLAHTINYYFTRDSNDMLQSQGAQNLYQAYRIANPSGSNLSVIFRDQYLANLIGFQYQRWEPQKAVDHFINQIKSNARKVSYEFPLVSVILDGENPWEHYPNNGIDFLRLLYERLSVDDEIETVRISDYLLSHPPERQLETIYSGSWINHNFSIWIGDKEDCQAWEYLAKTKETIKPILPALSKEMFDKVQENIHIAEGSDWFWWFGYEHSSVLDDQFDALFRNHLMNVYNLLGLNIPPYLYQPIKKQRLKELYNQPWGLLEIKLDGRRSDYFEWLAAGHFDVSANPPLVTTMDHSSKELISHIFFGFDRVLADPSQTDEVGKASAQAGSKNFCLRLDPYMPARQRRVCPAEASPEGKLNPNGGSLPQTSIQVKDNLPPIKASLATDGKNNTFPDDVYFVLNFLKPLKREIIIYNLYESSGKYEPVFSVLDENNNLICETLKTIAVDEIIEILCPLDILGFKKDDEIEFFVELYTAPRGDPRHRQEANPYGSPDNKKDKLLTRLPESQPIKLIVPAGNLEYINWIA
ncbi:MAG: glycoside hydrolase family 57 protein [Planctomycetota bacterium]